MPAATILSRLAVVAISAVVGVAVTLVGGGLLTPRGLQSGARPAPAYRLTGAQGETGAPPAPVAFDLGTAGAPGELIPGPPAGPMAEAAAALLDNSAPAPLAPLGYPRVPAVSQFDGGPLQNVNCMMAAGAMLARLGWGIVTTGSRLRSLQDDQEGGTWFSDLATALWRGYGVTFSSGLVTPDQLRRLLQAGAGAVIAGIYGQIPVPLRLQADFTGAHAIYLDGFYPGDPRTPPAYYVLDPLGRPGSGYRGDWWPASIVDAFATGFTGDGRIAAAWVFPPGGGPPPLVVGPQVLPLPPAVAGPASSAAPSPSSGSASPAASPGASPSGAVPSASGSLPPPSGAVSSAPPILAPVEPGDLGPSLPSAAPLLQGAVTLGGIRVLPALSLCLDDPRPSGCPWGIPAIYRGTSPAASGGQGGPTVTVRWVDADQPGVVLVAFTVDPPVPATVSYWRTDGGPAVVQEATALWTLPPPLGPLTVARLEVTAQARYQFVVTAAGEGGAALGPVGSFATAGGLASFTVATQTVQGPELGLAPALSPYRHLAPGRMASPPVACLAASGGRCQIQPGPPLAAEDSVPCGQLARFANQPLCLAAPPQVAEQPCRQASVDYALVGMAASGVVVRAFPTVAGKLEDGQVTLAGVLEADGPPGSGHLTLGCLAPGLSYLVVLDLAGDDGGPLASRLISAP
jgi:hypothetical protein